MSDKRLDNLLEEPETAEPDEEKAAEPDTSYEAIRIQQDNPEMPVYYTVVLSAAQPVQMLLPHDPQRFCAQVIAIDSPVVIAETEAKAQAAANLAENVPAPQGAYLPVGIRLPVKHTRECYVSATTTATSSRVMVLIEKR